MFVAPVLDRWLFQYRSTYLSTFIHFISSGFEIEELELSCHRQHRGHDYGQGNTRSGCGGDCY